MAVGRVQGINKVDGESKNKTLTVEYEPASVTVEEIQNALIKIGYESTLVA